MNNGTEQKLERKEVTVKVKTERHAVKDVLVYGAKTVITLFGAAALAGVLGALGGRRI